MRQYNFLQAIVMSFYSRALYRDVAKNWGASVVLYLLLLLALCWLAFMIPIQKIINEAYLQFSTRYVAQLPEMNLKNGEVTTPENRPYFITNPQTQKTVGIIDTSGKYITLQPTIQVLVTKTHFFYRDHDDRIKVSKISPAWTLHFKPQDAMRTLAPWVNWTWILVFPVMLFVSFVYRLLQALVYAVFGKIFAGISNIALPYVDVLKLSMVAITPVIILGTILDWFPITFHFEWLFYFILAMAYLLFAVRANK